MLKAQRRSWRTAFLALATAATTLSPFTGLAPAAADHGLVNHALEGLQDFFAVASQIDQLGALADQIPGTNMTPSDALGFADILDDGVESLTDSFVDKLTGTDVQAAIEGLQGTYGPVTVTIDGPNGAAVPLVQSGGGITDIVFKVTLNAPGLNLPVAFSDDLVDISGGTVAADLSLTSSMLHFQVDESAIASPATAPEAFWLLETSDAGVAGVAEAPAVTLNVSATAAAIASFSEVVGIGAVDITGTFGLDIGLEAALIEPDGAANDRITALELQTTTAEDLFNISAVAPTAPNNAVDVLLQIKTNLVGTASDVDATIAIVDALIDGTPPVVTPTLGELTNFLNLRPDDLLGLVDRVAGLFDTFQGSGRFDVEIPFVGGTFSDVLTLGDTLRALAQTDLRKQVDDPATVFNEIGQPTFETVEDYITDLGGLAGVTPTNLGYNATDDRITFDLAYSTAGGKSLPIDFGSLADVTGIELGAATASLNATFGATLPIAIDVSALPTETGAGPLSCVDGVDNDDDGDIDAADGDCGSLKTLDERITIDLSGVDEAQATLALTVSGLSGAARIGILQAMIDAGLTVENTAGTGPARAAIDLSVPGNLATLPDIVSAVASTGTTVTATPTLDIKATGTVGVSAQIGSTPLGTGNLVATAQTNGAFTSVTQLVDSLNVDTSGIDTLDMISFSPCGNGIDDDGDGVVDDGCDGGPAAVADPESESLAGFDKIVAAVRAVGGQVAGLVETFDDDIPLVGDSLSDVIDLVTPIVDLADQLAAGSEAALGGCGNDDDDDYDGFVNDGCPTEGPAPESGPDCAETPGTAVDDDGDGVKNDGCSPVIPSLQQLGDAIDGLLSEALSDVLADVTNDLGVATAYDDNGTPADKSDDRIDFKLTIAAAATKAVSLDAEFGGASIGGYELFNTESVGSVEFSATGNAIIRFGLRLSDFQPYIGGDTAVSLSGSVAGDNLEFTAGLGPLELKVGNLTADAEGTCTGDGDEDNDGYPNDGCAPQPNPESAAQCANGTDDDGDTVVNDGCGAPPAVNGDSESPDDCDGLDSDGDGDVDDGCPPWPAAAASDDGDPESGAQCAAGDTNDDDDDGFVNDGCPKQLVEPASFYLGATVALTEDGADDDEAFFLDGDAVAFSGGLTGVEQGDCGAGIVACATLPLYLEAGAQPQRLAAINIEWTDFATTPVPTFDGDVNDILDALGEAAIDLLLLETGVGEFIDKIAGFISDALLAVDFPLIGDQLKDLANLIDPADPSEKGLLDVKTAITAALGGNNPLDGLLNADQVVTAIDGLASNLDSALGSGVTVTGNVDCTGGDCAGKGIADVLGVSFDVSLGETIAVTSGGFDIGIPGLGLTSSDGGVGIAGGWSLDLGFGISREDGFYIKTGTDNELDVNATVTLPSQLTGILGFLQVDIYDGHPAGECTGTNRFGCTPSGVTAAPASTFGPQFFINLVDDGDGKLTFGELSQGPSFSDLFEYDLTATADVNLHIETSIDGDASLPRLFTDLFIDWSWSLTDALDPDGVGAVAPTIKLDNVYLDAGTFIGEFLQPVLSDVQRYTKPLDPIIDQLTTPIPVLSDFAGEPVTLITLAETFGPADNKYDLIFDLIKLVDFINGIDTGDDGLLLINIGDVLGGVGFDLDADKLRQGSLPASDARSVFDQSQLAAIDGGGSLVSKIDGKTGAASSSGISSTGGLKDIGLSFPFLDEPSQLMGLLFGQDVDLVVFRPKPLEFGFSYSQKFGPIWAVPPVFVEIGGSATITGRFGIGYDTQGLREVLFDDASAGALLNGLFLVDVDANGVDVNELEFEGRLFANAQVSVLIFSAGAEGSIFTTIGIDIVDPNSDGKLKFAEARDILVATGNPLCLFSLNGNFGVAIDVFAEVDLFFWSKKWTKTLAEIILYMFEVKCDFTKEPILASSGNYDLDQHLIGLGDGTSANETVLMLNLGARRAQRGAGSIGINTAEEEFVVKKELNNSVTVSAFGIDTNYPGPWDGIYVDMADAGDPDDVADAITFADNVVGGENESVAGSAATNRCGEAPGSAVDDDGDGAVNDGCPLADEFDVAEAGGQCNNATDDDGDGLVNEGCPKVEVPIPFDLSVVALNGSDGPDRITGGHGGHYIETGAGNDQVTTKEGNDKVVAGTGNDQVGTGDGDDVIVGGPDDAGSADDDDTLDGGPGADGIDGGDGSDVINGGLTIPAQPAQNILEQPDGIDTINGGPGDDEIDGGPGDDILNGNGGSDRISGDIGNDTINGGDETSSCDPNGNGRTLGDVLVGGPGSDTIHGNGGDDVIVGGNLTAGDEDTGDNLLDGDGGCDLILGDNGEFTDPENPYSFVIPTDGVGGNDAIEGGSGADELHGQVGNDNMKGQNGNDLMYGENADDDMDGGADSDVMYGDAGTPSYPNAGDDTVTGGNGVDQLFGEGGEDVLLGDDGSVTRAGTGDREDDTVTLGSTSGDDDDYMRGGLLRDVMFGQGGDDDMFGDSGDDLMFGNDGTDDMHGGIGPDEMFGGDGDGTLGDNMYGDSGTDRMIGGSPDGAAVDDGPDIMFGGTGNDVAVGDNGTINESFVETLLSEGTPAELANLEGDGDYIFGQAGEDRLFGELGVDVILGGAQDDYIEGNADDDVLLGEDGQDDIIGGGDEAGLADGSDDISGGAGVDVIAGDNAKVIRTGGTDSYDGSASRTVELHDLLSTDADVSGEDSISGGDAPDRIFAGGGDETVVNGDDGDDYIEGNGGGDLLNGNAGQDDIIGGTSQDDGPGSVFTGRDVAPVSNGGIPDGSDEIHGNDGHDAIIGDNGTVIRPLDGIGMWFLDDLDAGRIDDVARRVINIFDIAETTFTPVAGSFAGDTLFGEDDHDVVYGQGGNDTIRGGDVDDYLEGNDGVDTIYGENGQDDIVGGTGRTKTDDPASAKDGRLDDGDFLWGGDGDPTAGGADINDYDTAVGDNATIFRNDVAGDPWVDNTFNASIRRELFFYDVAVVSADSLPGTSGGDVIHGEDNDDVLYGQGGNDFVYGERGSDYAEGNDGSDEVYGGEGQDDLIGGTGLINGDRDSNYDPSELITGTAGRRDDGDRLFGGDDHDVLLGDNGIVDRLTDIAVDDRTTWEVLGPYDHFYVDHLQTRDYTLVPAGELRFDRLIRMIDSHPDDGGSELTAGSDVLFGETGDDDLIGQFDDTGVASPVEIAVDCIGNAIDVNDRESGDLLCGGTGEDALVGDQGVIVNVVEDGGRQEDIEPKDPFVAETIFVGIFAGGTLTRETELTQFVFGGDDILLGEAGSDSMHAGAGDDIANGGTEDDRIFGNDGVDAVWGGPNDDHLYGGNGGDFLDVQPRAGLQFAVDDPSAWFRWSPDDLATDGYDGFLGFDYQYGGWDQDAMQASDAGNGPIEGDRLMDWVGSYNIYYICPATNGAWVDIRAQEPGMLQFLIDMATGDGAFDVGNDGSSGYNDLALVYKPDVKDNANPPHPDTPGHFTCEGVPGQ